MPELPEVESIKRALQEKVVGEEIIGFEIGRGKVIKEPGPKTFKKNIIGQKIQSIERRAKLLIIKLSDGQYLIIHFRISGWLLYGEKQEKARVVFELSNGQFLNYMDQRLLGEVRLRKDYRDLKFVKELGPEPFEMSARHFKDILEKRKTNIKSLLLDQKAVAGIGNIYAQEALFLAKINPKRQADSLAVHEAKLLYQKIILVLKEGIKYHGSSVDSYRDLEGNKGGMEERLKVYGRKGEPCFICKRPIKKISLAGRGTCFCSYCQP